MLAKRTPKLIDVLAQLGLLTDLRVRLDVGDVGNVASFYRGTTGAACSDPSFDYSGSEYFSRKNLP